MVLFVNQAILKENGSLYYENGKKITSQLEFYFEESDASLVRTVLVRNHISVSGTCCIEEIYSFIQYVVFYG